MARNRGMYVDYGGRRGRRRRRGPSLGTVCGILIVIILAVIFGVLAYKVSRKNINDLPGVPTATPVPGTPTPVPTPTPSPTPTVTPTPTPTNTPTPVPTSPETGLPCTPTPTPTPAWDHEYLVGWTDTREKVNVKGIYSGLTLNKTENLNTVLELADTTELNAVVIDVKADTGKISYQMDNEYLQSLGVCLNTYTDMKGLLKTLKEHGIYTIARVVCFKDNFIDGIYPEYMIHNKDGSMYVDNEGNTWMDPYKEETWIYIVDIAEQAALDGFDEICFDYIRFATNGLSNADFGEAGEERTREQIITAFTKYACNRLKPLGVYVSASVYGVVARSSVDAAIVGQNFVEMSRYLDYICPMVYPSHYANGWAGIAKPNSSPYELVNSEMNVAKNKLAILRAQQSTYAEVRPWLQAFKWGKESYDGPTVRKQVDATYDAGFSSWFLWNSSGKYPDNCFLEE